MSGGQRTAISDSVRARIAGHARGLAGVFPSVYRSGSESSRQHSQRTSRLNTACLTANENPYWFGLLTKTHPDSTTPLRCQHGRCSIALICKTLRRNTGAYVFPTRFVEGGPRLWVEQPSLPFTGKAAPSSSGCGQIPNHYLGKWHTTPAQTIANALTSYLTSF